MAPDYFNLAVQHLRAAHRHNDQLAKQVHGIDAPVHGRIYLLWLNDAVIGVCWTEERARLEAKELRSCYAGPWREVARDHWSSDLVARLCIECRMVH